MRTPPNKKSPYTPLSVWRKMSLISQKNPYRFWNFIILRTAGDVNRIVKIFRGRGKDACSGIRTADRELRGMLSRYRRAARVGGCGLCRLPHVRRGFEYVRHAAEFMRFRCPACARRRIYSARGAYRAGRGCFRNLQIEFRCFNNVNQNRNEKTHTFGALLPCTVCSRIK